METKSWGGTQSSVIPFLTTMRAPSQMHTLFRNETQQVAQPSTQFNTTQSFAKPCHMALSVQEKKNGCGARQMAYMERM